MTRRTSIWDPAKGPLPQAPRRTPAPLVAAAVVLAGSIALAMPMVRQWAGTDPTDDAPLLRMGAAVRMGSGFGGHWKLDFSFSFSTPAVHEP